MLYLKKLYMNWIVKPRLRREAALAALRALIPMLPIAKHDSLESRKEIAKLATKYADQLVKELE